MDEHEKYMNHVFSLAENGIGYVAPNPMVGCVIVEGGEIIGEGFHQEYGKPHAEVNAIRSVKDVSRLSNATLYVNLEPCNHYGKTPPCTELVLKSGIKKVVTANMDPNPLVSGSGIQLLRENGVEVISGVLEDRGHNFNKRFFCFHQKKRPYIILKWAQTKDGFISKFPVPKNRKQNLISGEDAQWMTHIWRSHEQAIMVGTNTVLLDNPQLNVRLVKGKDPVKIILDRELKLGDARLLQSGAKTLVFTESDFSNGYGQNFDAEIEFIKIPFNDYLIRNVLKKLHEHHIISILVEGGAELLQSFIDNNLFDEIRVFESKKIFGEGISAPFLALEPDDITRIGGDELKIYRGVL